MSDDVEQCYVHRVSSVGSLKRQEIWNCTEFLFQVYTKLAAHSPQSSYDNAPQRSWPNVSKFIQSQEAGSVIVDVGEYYLMGLEVN